MRVSVAILGAGVSGQAAQRLVHSLGFKSIVFDQNGFGDVDTLTSSDIEQFNSFILSPGMAADHPWRKLAESSGKPCHGELSFAARHWKGKVIGITGTNGKTTVTKLMAESLQATGRKAIAVGNIGYAFSDAVVSEQNTEDTFAVLEVSSFQAELSFGLELDALLWTNFAEDHLDRYDSMLEYFLAKAKLLSCLRENGVCVVGAQVSYWMHLLNCEFDACSFVNEKSLVHEKLAAHSPFRQFPQTENYSLLAELWSMLDLPENALIQSANDFELAPHRLQCEATRNEVSFWNDSKATNFHAALAALASLSKPIFWIGGGQMKGGDVEAFATELANHVSAAFVYGEAGPRLAAKLEKTTVPVVLEDRFEDVVLAAAHAADGISGAKVLLSPGFSSFDQFSNYQSRGKCFISTVLGLNGALAAQ